METKTALTELIEKIPFLADASPQVRGALQEIADIVLVSKGTLLFSEGEFHGYVYFVATGTIALDMVSERCIHQQILSIGDGDLLGWSAILTGGAMTASALALEECCLVAFQADRLRTLCEKDHDIGYIVMKGIAKLLSRRLLATRIQFLDVFHHGRE